MRRLVLHIVMAGLLVASLGAEQLTPTAVAAPSVVDRWLDPQTLLMIGMALLFVGEIRGDIKRIKARMEELSDASLAAKFMPRELLEEKLKHLMQRDVA